MPIAYNDLPRKIIIGIFEFVDDKSLIRMREVRPLLVGIYQSNTHCIIYSDEQIN